jgi:hypothetical protein
MEKDYGVTRTNSSISKTAMLAASHTRMLEYIAVYHLAPQLYHTLPRLFSIVAILMDV